MSCRKFPTIHAFLLQNLVEKYKVRCKIWIGPFSWLLFYQVRSDVHIGAISWDLKVLFGNNFILPLFVFPTSLQDNISHCRSLPHRRIGEECKAHQVFRLLYEAWLGVLRHPSQGSLCSRCCNDDHQPLGVPCVLLELLKSCDGWVHEAPKWGWCGHDGLRPWQGSFWALSEMESYWRLCICGVILSWKCMCLKFRCFATVWMIYTRTVLWHVLVSGDVVWFVIYPWKMWLALAVYLLLCTTPARLPVHGGGCKTAEIRKRDFNVLRCH